MENRANVSAIHVAAVVIANLEPDSGYVSVSLRQRAMSDNLQSLAERIASNRQLRLRLTAEVASCREEINRAQAATLLSVTCSPGAAELFQLQALVDSELSRRAIESVGLG